MINNRVKQYVLRIAVTALSVDENLYKKNSKNIFKFIKTLQIFDASTQRNRIEILTTYARKLNVSKFKWIVDVDDFFKYKNKLYVFNEKSIRVKLLKRHHDDILTNYFDVIKTTKLFSRKYYWFNIIKYVKNYVKICDICQKTKTLRHFSYDIISFLFMSIRSWNQIIMNFIIELFFNKYRDNTYNACFVICDRYTKMTLYFSIIKIIDSIEFAKLLFEKKNFWFEISFNMISNKNSIFINNY